MRVVFMGTPDFSVAALRALSEAGHEIVAVYSQPPRKSGRGQKLRPSPVQAYAECQGWTVFTPKNFRDLAELANFVALEADIAVVVAYGLILPQALLDAPRFGCLNIHASLLPRWRGAAPIHRAIMAGDAQTGVCIMQMDEGLDTGPVRLRRALAIALQETTAELHHRLAALGAAAIVDVLADLPGHPPKVQLDVGICYAQKIDKSEARIDWTRPALEVDRQIRALSPFPGAWCELAGKRIKLLTSQAVQGSGTPGQVLGGFEVACSQGSVIITRVQLAGKTAQTATEFLQGHALPGQLD
ncbi:MAG: methionyl-tRNA formyltransferase [Planktomarina sp.]|uniref:methionyl-tRNA formyltransferase n=1 Tax=Planktomarina sp. TaxID=2024851 RepID=UPI0028913AD3|nr:methionyl-tRNA formyltransferase [Planktomarina sp.]MDG1294609.1 methionyl-tRNA formyltransferase [Planktomarina sp.]MDT2030404.1 methionyl-tRNA formyltransferase [Planktomarina sp.]MDT2070133.1 methionyl-tRNA formyltransferase [Planktomarina sp.]